jgi:beta-1,4-galactosyltransferase 1
MVVEQNDDKLFNRGTLINAGIREAIEQAYDRRVLIDCIVTHDVDVLPYPGVPYTSCAVPIHLSSEVDRRGWTVPYKEWIGSVISMRPQDWLLINGFSNEYRGWGKEDDELFFRLRDNGLTKEPQLPYRPPKGHGKFMSVFVDSEKGRSDHGNIKRNAERLLRWQKEPLLWQKDGLSQARYNILSEEYGNNYSHIKISF